MDELDTELEDEKEPLAFDVTLLYANAETGYRPEVSMERNFTFVVESTEQLNEALKLEPSSMVMGGVTIYLDKVEIVERSYP